MTKLVTLFALLAFGAIAQQITNPNTGTWAGTPGSQVFSPFPLQGRPQWEPSPDGLSDTQIIFDYLEPGILACAGEIGGLKNSVFAIQTQMTTFQTSLDTLSGNISALSQNQRTTGIGGGGAVAVPGLDKVLTVSGDAPNHGAKIKTLQTTENIYAGTHIVANGTIGAHSFSSESGMLARGRITMVSDPIDSTDAATKSYVDSELENAGTDTVTLYTVVPSGSGGLRLQPVKISGVKAQSTAGLESYELQPVSVLVSASGSGGKLTTSSETIWAIAPSTNRTESVVIEFVDHGTLN